MKKIIVITIIIAIFFTFQTAIRKYDRYITDKFFDFNPGENIYELSVSGYLSSDDVMEFQEFLMLSLDRYNLHCYQKLYKDQEITEYIAWVYTTDEFYFNNIFLTKGVLTEINKGDYYFSNDGNQKGLIFNPVRNKNYMIYHLDDFNNDSKSIFNPYILFSYADNAETLYNNLYNDLKTIYPDLFIDFAIYEKHGSWGWGNEELNNNDIVFAILTGIMVIICLNIDIISQTKKIQILKLGGFNSFQIYLRFILKNIGVILFFALICNIILFLIYIETSLSNAEQFISMLITPNIIFIVSLLLFSVISFSTILLVNVNTAIKGKSSLKNQQILNYLMKTLLIMFTTGTILNSVSYLSQYYTIATTEEKYLERIENLYHSPAVLPQYIAAAVSDDFRIDNALLRNEHLINNNEMFEMIPLDYILLDGKEFIIFAISEEYVRKNVYGSLDIGNNKSTLIIPDSLSKYQEQIIKSLGNIFHVSEQMDILILPQVKLDTINPWHYISEGLEIIDAIIVTKPSTNVNLNSNSYFSFPGDVSEVQDFYDNICSMFDTPPLNRINNVKALYNSVKANFIQHLWIVVPISVVAFTAIAINIFYIAVLSCEIEGKKYALLKSEGRGTFALIGDKIKICALILLTSQAFLIWFIDIDLTSIFILIAFYFLLDLLILWTVTYYKMKNFPERLR